MNISESFQINAPLAILGKPSLTKKQSFVREGEGYNSAKVKRERFTLDSKYVLGLDKYRKQKSKKRKI